MTRSQVQQLKEIDQLLLMHGLTLKQLIKKRLLMDKASTQQFVAALVSDLQHVVSHEIDKKPTH